MSFTAHDFTYILNIKSSGQALVEAEARKLYNRITKLEWA